MKTMLKAIAILAVGAALGCSPPAQNNASPQSAEQARQEVAEAAMRMETGQWRTTITIVEANIPGVPADIARQMMGQPIVVEECRTSEDPQEATAAWAEAQEGCDAGTFRLNGNRFEGARTCSGDGATMTMTYTGTLTATRMEGETRVEGQSPIGPMSQRATIVSERLGACAG
jgi:hypothetical protein